MKKIILKSLLAVSVLLFSVLIVNSIVTSPSNDRDWILPQKILPFAEIKDNLVTVHNIRNFRYTSMFDYEPNYYDKTFDLRTIKNVWYIVEPFPGVPGSAHTFLSFEFENNQFLAISVEIRKEQGEIFGALRGLFNQFEIMYVIADERDVVKLRSNFRKDPVYVYPAQGTHEGYRDLFVDMLMRANKLHSSPEFYNTATNNCTTNIVKHVNKVSPKSVPFFTLQSIFPEYSDKLAYELGLLKTTLPFEEARTRYLINEKAIKYADDENFSVKIRE